MKHTIQILGLCCLITGCELHPHYSKEINQIAIGMSREDVIKILGEPINTTADRESTYLNYGIREGGALGPMTPYAIRMVGGKVDAYGRSGPTPQIQTTMPVFVPIVH